MSAGSLADGFVELQLKTDQMQAEMRQVIAETGKMAKQAEDAFSKVANKGVKRVTEEVIRQRREYVRLGDEYRRSMGYDATGGMASGRGARIAGYASAARGIISSTIMASTALTFAAAAAAGSTTFETLTGSLRMLSLAAGAKTQGAVLGLSKGIQGLAHFVDKLGAGNVEAAVLGLTGASLGYRLSSATVMGKMRGVGTGAGLGIGAGLALGGFETTGGALMGGSIGANFGPLGALAGAGAGAIIGELKKLYDQKATGEEKVANKILAKPGGIEEAIKLADEFKKKGEAIPTGLLGRRTDEAVGWLSTAEELRKGAERAKQMLHDREEGFKMAGLNMPLTMSSLAGAYDQGNMAMMGMSPLEISNKMREWKLNMEGTMKSRTSVDPNFVGPPQGN